MEFNHGIVFVVMTIRGPLAVFRRMNDAADWLCIQLQERCSQGYQREERAFWIDTCDLHEVKDV